MDFIIIILKEHDTGSGFLTFCICAIVLALIAAFGPALPYWAVFGVPFCVALYSQPFWGYIILGLILAGALVANIVALEEWRLVISVIQSIILGFAVLITLVFVGGLQMELWNSIQGWSWWQAIIAFLFIAVMVLFFCYPLVVMVNSVVSIPFSLVRRSDASTPPAKGFFGQLICLLGTCFLFESLAFGLNSLIHIDSISSGREMANTFRILFEPDFTGLYQRSISAMESVYYAISPVLRFFIGAGLSALGLYMELSSDTSLA